MLPNNDQSLYGAPMGNNGMAVDPMFAQSARPGNASPSMSYEDGGAIPEEEDQQDQGYDQQGENEESGLDAQAPDDTTRSVATALKIVNQALVYGRQKHGLPTDQNDDKGGDEASFEDGGAIPDQDEDVAAHEAEFPDESPEQMSPPAGGDDNSGAIPVMGQEDNSGAPPVMSGNNDDQQKRGAAQTVLSYLMGTDGVAPQVLDSYKADTKGSEADRNLMAVQRAFEEDGEKGAWGAVQALRRKFDLFMNHGRAAANNDDYENAAQSIMKAFENLPDGQNVQARPAQDGVNISATDADGKAMAGATLNRQQLDALTNTGKAGQFDAALKAGGAAGVLQTLQRGTGYIGANGLARVNGDSGGGYGRYGRDPQTGKQFTEGNRPSTPSEIADMTRMRRSMGDKSNGNGADPGVLSFPGYKAYQQKYAGGQNTDGGPDATPGAGSGRPVRVIGQGAEDKTYINGVDQAPTEQQKKLELIRARGEGRSASGDKRLEAVKLQEEGKNSRAQQTGERQSSRDKAISERREKSGGLSTERAQRSLDYRVAGERLRLKKEGYKDEDIEKMIAAAGFGKSSTPPAAAPQASAPQAPQSRQPSPQDQAAVNWARSNPEDPRAQKILRLNGVQ